MLTRRRIRKWLCWTGIAVGVLALAGLVFTLFGSFSWRSPSRAVMIAAGGMRVEWEFNAGGQTGTAVNWGSGAGLFHWLPQCSAAHSVVSGTGRSWEAGQLVIPFWFPVAIGLFCVYRMLPESGRSGRCPGCSFNLEGAPEVDVRKVHVRCTECGLVSEREKESKVG